LDNSILAQAKNPWLELRPSFCRPYIFAARWVRELLESQRWLKKLRLADYDGWLVIEQDTTPGRSKPKRREKKTENISRACWPKLPPDVQRWRHRRRQFGLRTGKRNRNPTKTIPMTDSTDFSEN